MGGLFDSLPSGKEQKVFSTKKEGQKIPKDKIEPQFRHHKREYPHYLKKESSFTSWREMRKEKRRLKIFY